MRPYYHPGTILGAPLSHVGFSGPELCAVDGPKCELWDKMKMANAIKAVRSEEMGLKKRKYRCSKCRDRHSKTKLVARKQLQRN